MSSPHSVWTSFPEAADLGGAQPRAANSASAAEAAAAREEMVSAATGMMAEASRLASDIVSAGALNLSSHMYILARSCCNAICFCHRQF